jgi:predicted component of type VI protein secretion system
MKLSGRTAALASEEGRPTIHVTGGVVLVGRSSECDVVVDSKRISRKHCCIALVRDRLVIKDLGSTNGCRVNGERGEELTAGEGDEVTIGDAVYRFCWDHPSDMTMRPVQHLDEESAAVDTAERTKPAKQLDASDPLMHLPGLA